MEEIIHVPTDRVLLEGILNIPTGSKGLVLFAHGSGSGRNSPRNNFVAKILNQGGIATLLIDLLSEQEDQRYETRFDIDLLTTRVKGVFSWLKKQRATQS